MILCKNRHRKLKPGTCRVNEVPSSIAARKTPQSAFESATLQQFQQNRNPQTARF